MVDPVIPLTNASFVFLYSLVIGATLSERQTKTSDRQAISGTRLMIMMTLSSDTVGAVQTTNAI